MKLSLVLIGSALGQAPPIDRTCADCTKFDEDVHAMYKADPSWKDKWSASAVKLCGALGPLSKPCETQMATSFDKMFTEYIAMDPKTHCTNVTMCAAENPLLSKADPPKMDPCTDCTLYVQDIIMIARYDPDHFAKWWTVVGNSFCSTLSAKASKTCLAQLVSENGIQNMEQNMANQDPMVMCSMMDFCQQ